MAVIPPYFLGPKAKAPEPTLPFLQSQSDEARIDAVFRTFSGGDGSLSETEFLNQLMGAISYHCKNSADVLFAGRVFNFDENSTFTEEIYSDAVSNWTDFRNEMKLILTYFFTIYDDPQSLLPKVLSNRLYGAMLLATKAQEGGSPAEVTSKGFADFVKNYRKYIREWKRLNPVPVDK